MVKDVVVVLIAIGRFAISFASIRHSVDHSLNEGN